MIKKLAKSIREYKAPSIITMLLMVGEVVIECLIPLIVSDFIDYLDKNKDDDFELAEFVKNLHK